MPQIYTSVIEINAAHGHLLHSKFMKTSNDHAH